MSDKVTYDLAAETAAMRAKIELAEAEKQKRADEKKAAKKIAKSKARVQKKSASESSLVIT
jgi:hypothetical protein